MAYPCGIAPRRHIEREFSIRDDQNALATTANSKAKQETKENVMTSWGEFGSVLAMIFGDAANGKVNWSHWEQNAGSAVVVFNYSVPKTASHYVVVGTIPPSSCRSRDNDAQAQHRRR
jgi:hypothetical protein